jgi:branched-chain amino acid transport system permease protein
MDAVLFYGLTILVYFGCNALMAMGLTVQFGWAGILNFCYYILVAIGGYAASLSAIGPVPAGMNGVVEYIGGWTLPWPIPVAVAALAGSALAVFIAVVAVRRLQSDYLAIGTLVVGEIAWFLTGNTTGVVNGWNGLTGVPQPLSGVLNLPPLQYNLVFTGIVLAIAALGFWVLSRLQVSPFGRALRAMRENEGTAAACGKDVFALRLKAMVVGGVFAAVGGALFIEFIGSISPYLWDVPETFVLFAALIVGGNGNRWGTVLGAALVPVAFLEATRFVPAIGGNAATIPALRWVVIGLLVILMLLFRPEGILPEPKGLVRERAPALADAAAARAPAPEAGA